MVASMIAAVIAKTDGILLLGAVVWTEQKGHDVGSTTDRRSDEIRPGLVDVGRRRMTRRDKHVEGLGETN